MKEISDGNFMSAINNQDLCVVDFYATWCMPCMRMENEVNHIDETNQKMIKIKNYSSKIEKFSFEHASTLTKVFAMDILQNDCCKLPTIVESYVPHLEIFRIFNHYINSTSKRNVKLCPIT